MNTSPGQNQYPKWVMPLFKALQLPDNASVAKIFATTDNVASRLAPNTRRLWKWILTLEGGAVLLPLLWFLVLRLRWPPIYTAYAVMLCTFIVVGICWWLRWRGMQHTWVQARLVAEICRSATATCWLRSSVTIDALVNSPPLQAIARQLPEIAAKDDTCSLEELKDTYLQERLDNQLHYYQSKQQNAIHNRHLISQCVTWSLDGALFLAVAGLVLALSASGEKMLRLSGVDYILGAIGTLLPLIAILMQTLSSYLELNRRTGRYAQQLDFLTSTKKRLIAATSRDNAIAVIKDVEMALLGEVVEWFYETEHAETFYRSKTASKTYLLAAKIRKERQGKFGEKTMAILGACVSYTGRVILGRVLIVALSMVVTTALIAYYAPQDHSEQSIMSLEDGRLLSSPTSASWAPLPQRAEQGFILIAHGLHDGVETAGNENTAKHWMTRMQDALTNELGPILPDICLVDWRRAAVPSLFSKSGLEGERKESDQTKPLPKTPQGWLQDIAAIRPRAEEIGKLVGFKLAMAINDGKISSDKPMHFIGHSAGGFVVLEAALVLHKLGLAPEELYITLLDTPAPNTKTMALAAEYSPIDYYCTSSFAQGIPQTGWRLGYSRFDIVVPSTIDNFIGAHSYAHKWFIESISNKEVQGFSRSPFSK